MAESKSTLAPGMKRTGEFTVEGRLVTSVGGTIGAGTHQRRIVSFGQLG